MTNKVYLMDCMEWMAGLPDNYADLAIVDPPYGIGWDKERESMSAGLRKDGSKRKSSKRSYPKPKKYKKGNYDNSIPEEKYFDELFRVSKNQIIWGGIYFTKYLEPTGGWIFWDKQVVMPTLSKGELAWTSFLGHVEIFKYLWAGYRKKIPEDRIHINQKPIALYRWLLLNYAKPGYKIIDTHVGSGSLRIVCDEMFFHFEGTEIDPDYWQDQEDRYLDYCKQGRLFDIEEIQNRKYLQNNLEL